jgi:hypothetical protein
MENNKKSFLEWLKIVSEMPVICITPVGNTPIRFYPKNILLERAKKYAEMKNIKYISVQEWIERYTLIKTHTIPLQEQLDAAVAEENYLLAADLKRKMDAGEK